MNTRGLSSPGRRSRGFDARPSELLLSLVRRARCLWLGWLEGRWNALRALLRTRRSRQQRPQGTRFETLEPKLLLSGDLMPIQHASAGVLERQVDAPALHGAIPQVGMARALGVQAPSSAPLVIVTGPGSGNVVAQGAGYLLQLTGTTSLSNVSLVSATQVALTGISADSAVGTLALANADLSGNATFAASVGTLTLGQVSHANIGVATGATFTFNAGQVSDTVLLARSAAVAITVSGWSASVAGASRIEAAAIKSLTTTGDMAADVFVSGVGVTGYALTTVQVGGAISGGLWSVHGRGSSISAGSTAAAWRMNISGPLVQLLVKGDASGDLALASLQLLQVTGSTRGLHLLVGANLGDDAALGGAGANADTFQAGTLARVRIGGDMVDTNLIVSVDPVNGVFFDGNDRQLGTAVQRLQELTVNGKLLGSTSVVAPMFPTTVSVGGVSVNPATLPQLGVLPPDRIPPLLISFGLEAASDSAPVGDGHTTINPVNLVGMTEAGAALTLRRSGSSTVLGTAVAAAGGSFRFSGIALDLGANAFVLTLADAAGNTSTGNLSVTRDAIPDATPPTLTAALANDTGTSASDGITADPTISGSAQDNVGVTQLLVALDPGATASFTDLVSLLQPGGSFTLSRAVLDTLAGGSLADGLHVVRVVAKDAAGNASTPVEISFRLDTHAPVASSFGLDPASDSAPVGDGHTTANPVNLVGGTEAGASLTLRLSGSSTVLGTTVAAADGSFHFSGIALSLGANAFVLTLADAAGNASTSNLTVTRDALTVADTIPPTLTAALANDTGISASDGITSDPTITGNTQDNVGVTHVLVALDPGATPSFTDLIGLLQPSGTFTLSRAVLNTLAGGSLTDGSHVVRVVAQDAAGNASAPVNVAFRLDTQAPTGASFGIGVVDALAGNDAQTGSALVTLQGLAEGGSTITLAAQGLTSTADANGKFQLPGVALALGDNSITLSVADAAGNAQTVARTLTRVAATQADPILEWTNIALKAIQSDATDPPVATRVLALQSISVYDTLAAIQGTPAFLVQRSISGNVDAYAAVEQAAYRVLYQLYPAQRASLDASLAADLAKIPDGAAKTAGIALGDSIAMAVIALRANDGYLTLVNIDGSSALGAWRPTGPGYAVAQDPQWGSVTPFALTSGSEFRAPPPPALDSPQYAAAINQVQSLGRATNSTRTADQTQQALFWADGGGSYTPPGHWDAIATQIAAAKGNSLSANARLMAQLNVALADAAIAAWDTKYTYDFWRPVTAIQNADLDNNPATTVDPNWTPFLITPPHPSYVSGHSTFSAAAAGILAATFGDNTSFSSTSPTLPGVTRSFTSFSQAADEAGLSRIYCGIHTSLDNNAGKLMGTQVAQAVLARFALTQDKQPPKILLGSAPAATRTNPVINGQVIDNLSGVASAQVRVDGGALQGLTLDANGSFSFSPSFALDGSADGNHTVAIVATDKAGNVSSPTAINLTLDTKAPTLALSSIADGASLVASSRLTGNADGTGSNLTMLNYSIDGGGTTAIAFTPGTSAFDQALNLANLGIGSHTLTLSARDAAGNSTTLTRQVKVDSLPLLTIAGLSPTDGSTDVGSTFRPKLVFSRAVNTATLTGDSFYATGPDGGKVPASIVPAADGTYAWLFFNSPLPGGSLITLHVVGSSIRGASDGSFLDAAGSGHAGSSLTTSFTTVSLSSVVGTKLVGRVVDPGPDLVPMTFDDVRRGPDGILHTADDVYLNPIANAKVTILGTGQVVYTDATGYFEFNNAPIGDVKLAVDGRTATNSPNGAFWPEMVMDLTLRAGITNTAMGSMGSLAVQQANAGDVAVYLPRVPTSALQTVAADVPTVITTPQVAAPKLTDEQRNSLTLTVQPGSAVGSDGKALSNVQIGVATVPPELVKDMLPAGVAEHSFDITIQAPGVAVFTKPVQITFPNVFNAAPGTQLDVLSFDHTTGRLVINGTATVSADGKTVVSDPGSGIVAPGWHGLTPPGAPSDPPCPPATHDIDVPPVLQTSGIKDYFFPKDSGTMNLSFANNAAKINPNSDACSTENVRATPLLVEVSLDDASAVQFLDGVHQQTFSLEPQQVGNINGTVHALLGQISTYSADRLYGLKIHMHTHWVDKNGVDHNLDGQMPATDIYAYRFLDIADNRHDDGKMDFPRIAAGVGFTQKEGLTYYGDAAAKPQKIAVGTGTDFSVAGDQIQFTPTTTGTLNDVLTITAPDAKDVGKVNLSGVGLALQNVFFSESEFSARVAALVDASPVVAGTQRLVDMFPDTDGNGSRTTGVDKAFFDATVLQLFNDITVQFYVTMLGVDSTSLSTLTLVNGTPGTGDKVNLRNVAIGGAPYTGSAAAVWADFGIDYFLTSIVPNEANMSKPQIQYLFDGLFNRSVSDNSGSAFVPGGSGLIVNVDKMVAGAAGAAPAGAAAFRSTLVNQFASTIGHEFGHLLGAIHQRTNSAPYSSNYLMGLGTLLTTIPAIGPDFINVFKAGLGIPSTAGEFQTAYNYYKLQANNDYTIAGQAYAFNNGGNPVPGPGHLIDEGDLPAYLAVVDGPADDHQPPNVVGNLDFGTVNADGAGGALASKTVWLFNTGNHPLHLSSVDVQGGPGFSVAGFAGPQDLAAFDPSNPAASRLALTVTFDPSALGRANAKLHIVSNSSAGASTDIPLSGLAVSPFGHLAVSVPNNNVGGTKVGSTGAVTNFGTITNDGTQPLSITQALSNSPDFAVTGALASASVAAPLVLAPGASTQFGVTFTPAKISLDRGAITISSNDPTQATFKQALVGTGLAAQGTALQYGNDYIELDQPNSPNIPPLRMISGPDGQWSFFLPPSTPVHYTIFDPVSGLVAHGWDTTAPSGKTTMFTQANFQASTAPDTNGNGLPDDIKFAIGTSPNSQDTNHDGISDFDSIRLGLNPLGNLGAPTGVLSSAALTGSAEAVAVSAAVADPNQLTAYVATGNRGLAVVDVTNFTKPSVLAEISLPGNNVDVAVDAARGVAAVAGGDAGLSLVDISKPTAPVLMQTVAFGVPVGAVQVRDGIAFVATGNDLALVNLLTGDLLQSVNLTTLGGSTVTSLGIDGSNLYSVDASHTLRSFAIDGSQLTVLGSLALPAGGGRLFVGGGVAYIGAGNGALGGFATADVSNPAAMTVLSGVTLNSVGGTSVVPNGSGLAVAVGSSSFAFGGFKSLDLMNVSDPKNTGTLVTRYNLPAVPRDVVIANGLAFVADSTGGLQIVNYVAFDAKGVPPQVVSLKVDAKDADPGTPGVQVLEGRAFTVRPTVSDDVQARNVELLVDGKVVADAAAFPFAFTAQAPTLAVGGNKLTVQVRVTDTGGNSTLSAPVVFDVVKDTFPPVLQTVSVDEGARRFFVKSVDFAFDEPLDTARLTTTAISLVRVGPDGVFGTADDVSVPVTLNFRSLGQVFSVLPGGYLPPGDYQLTVKGSAISDKAGNVAGTDLVRHFTIRPASDVRATSGAAAVATAPSANPGQQIGVSVPFDPSTAKANFQTIDANGTVGSVVASVFRFDTVRGIAYFNVPLNAYTGDCVVYGQVGSVITNFADGTFPLQIVPVVTGLSVQSVSADGTSATVVVYGRGFVEGNNSQYRLGTTTVLDAGVNTGPDVQSVYDYTYGQYANGQVVMTVALSNGVFGAISAQTAGGTSASFSASLAAITGTALSGTPADPTQASANAGQSVTLSGSGLSTSSAILLRYVNVNGVLQMVKLTPSLAAADGSSATLTLPAYVNGAFTLQMFGSTSQPLLQIVPTITSVDVQDRTVLFGSGYVEGAATYNFAGASVTDTPADPNNIDVYYDSVDQNRSAYLNRSALPTHGLGNVTVTTAGGTSAAFALNSVRVSVAGTSLGDVAVDASGKLWVGDYTNPGHLLKIDPATGQVLQSITMTADFGAPYAYNHLGLQVLGAAMSLGGTSVPAGSLLVFNGQPNPDRVVAVNPGTGSIIASVTLDANYDLTGGTYSAANGHLYITENNGVGNRIIELDATTGKQVAAITAPFNIQSWSGLAIDPTTGHLWLGAINGGDQLVEYRIDATGVLTELRRLDASLQNIRRNEISGLSFAPDGSLWVASTQGEIYKLATATDPAAIANATLSQIVATAGNGVAANAGLPAANVGQVIELDGSNFGPGTRVLFNTRDNAGNTRVVAQTPLAINDGGTRLQVQVPDQASTGDVRVVNVGWRNLGFSGYADAVYRNVSVSFTAAGSTSTIAFSDGGLEGLDNESWGLDNVTVSDGATTVFSDNFESGTANPAWSNASVDSSAIATFSRFGGRYNNASQRLNLTGLTAGKTYTLNFDLLVLDSWDGNNASAGPDLIDVSVDGVSKLRETLANTTDPNSAQTFRASPGIKLQVVPTLSSIDGGQPGSDAVFNLRGSGFMAGASTVMVGGVALPVNAANLYPFAVSGSRNDTLNVVAPRTLDGPIRISTDGGYAEIPGTSLPVQPISLFTGIVAQASAGTATDTSRPSAVAGQTIVLQGQGFTNSTLVQFQGIDDSGRLGTLTRSGSAGNGGTTLSLVVPALARSGAVTVLGSGASISLQIVPTLRAVGGAVAAGNTLVLEGTGLTANDLVVSIDGRGVGSFAVRTLVDGTNAVDQQLLTLTVPAGVGAGVITVSTAGGTSVLRSGATSSTALADITPATDIGDTLATALNPGLGANQRVNINGSMPSSAPLNVDMVRVDLTAGDQLALNMANSAGLYAYLRVFDANGAQQLIALFSPGSSNTAQRWTAPATGAYYVGVSGYSNTSYNPKVANSGNNASYFGTYALSLERYAAGASHLGGITTSAASGSAANAAIGSANVGQTVTVSGAGLLANDQLVFTTLDDGGNLAEAGVASTVDLLHQTISAVVPINATTGHVRLARDTSGVLLQVVPTLSGATMTSVGGSFTGNNLQLSGSGFAEGAISVLLGAQSVADIDRYYGLDVFNNATRINMTVPTGMPTGPIRVSTVGGTSAAFTITLGGITAAATSGTPTDATQASANPGQAVTLSGSGLSAGTDVVFQTIDASGNRSDVVVLPTSAAADGSQITVVVPLNAVTGQVRILGAPNALALQIVPVVTGLSVQSVSSDGTSATVVVYGRGFVEGNNSQYRLGTTTVLDAGVNTGPDVQSVYDYTYGQYANGQVVMTVALSNGVFGAISAQTAGGTSASFSASLAAITGTALSGTPADPTQASANAGQSVTLSGSGLSTSSAILLRYVNVNGVLQMVKLTPSLAAADGSSATLTLPAYVNGAFTLQMFGSTSQPLLQIVPTITSVDVQDRTVLFGSGYVEGAATYNFAGASVTDTPADPNNIDVYYDSVDQNRSAYLNRSALPTHGLGNVTVTTAGGTSAAFALNSVRVSVAGTSLGDVAVDASGKLWVGDYTNPGHLLKIDPATGQVLQSITMTADFGAPYAYNHLGLQVLGAAMSLGGTSVPAGSLLVFNGQPNPDRVVAVNPGTGSIIASVTLDANYDLTGGTYSAANGHLYITENNGVGNRIIELDATTGKQVAAITAPFNIQSWSGLAIDPTTGHLWLGAINGGDQLVEYRIDATGVLTELRRLDASLQNIRRNEISGLSFAPDGSLWVASTQGEIYKLHT